MFSSPEASSLPSCGCLQAFLPLHPFFSQEYPRRSNVRCGGPKGCFLPRRPMDTPLPFLCALKFPHARLPGTPQPTCPRLQHGCRHSNSFPRWASFRLSTRQGTPKPGPGEKASVQPASMQLSLQGCHMKLLCCHPGGAHPQAHRGDGTGHRRQPWSWAR